MVFPIFFNLSLNLAIRSSWSEPQSAPGLVFADYIELLYVPIAMLDLVNIKLNKTFFLAFNKYSLIVFCDYLRTIFLQNISSIFYLA